MTDTTLVDLESTVDAHLAGYCEPDPDPPARAAADRLGARRAPRSTRRSTAPAPTGVAALVDAVLEPLPRRTRSGARPWSTRTTTCARYGWELVAPDGTVAVAGTDVVTLGRRRSDRRDRRLLRRSRAGRLSDRVCPK